jgi:hypothetical protein
MIIWTKSSINACGVPGIRIVASGDDGDRYMPSAHKNLFKHDKYALPIFEPDGISHQFPDMMKQWAATGFIHATKNLAVEFRSTDFQKMTFCLTAISELRLLLDFDRPLSYHPDLGAIKD